VALASKSPGPALGTNNTGPHNSSRDSRFLIAWIDVQNKQGEDKGLMVIWPISLALSFLPSATSSHASRQLSHLPDLPSQLQPSPPPPAAPVPAVGSLTAAVAASPITSLGRSPPPPPTPTDLPPALTRRLSVPGVIPYPASHNPKAGVSSFQFDPDSSSRDDVHTIAGEVGEYIEAVVKERERERERLRRERESSGPSMDASPARAMSTVNTPGSVGISSPMSATLTGTMSSPPMIGPDAISTILAPVPLSAPFSAGADPPPQPFYPSPQSSSVPPSSVEIITQSLSASSTISEPFAPPVESSASTIASSSDAVTFSAAAASVPSFDTFTGFENWSQSAEPWQSTGGILAMPLDDVSMGVGMSIDSLPYSVDPIAGGGGSGGWGTSDMRMDIDGTGIDSIFTEADFDFWDDGKAQQSGISSTSASVPPPLSISRGTSLTHTTGPTPLGMTPQLFEDAKIPVVIPSSHAPMWPPSALVGSFTQPGGMLDPAAELIPSSPTKTLSPPSGPATPRNVVLDPAVRLTPRSPLAGGGIFDAIPFASTYRVADGKYTEGKFALPSPPDEEDRTQSITGLLSPQGGAWNRYDVATDPRVGVVRRLMDIKRKISVDGCAETSEWIRGSQEWTKNVMQTPPPEEGYTLSDDSESDEGEDDDMQLDEDDEDEVPSPVTGSRPFTPLPSYLPLGPKLLHMHFQHNLLLPLSTPLRPSRPAASPSGQTPGAAPVSVPTPVSPAALVCAASEKSKSLEAAAQILAKEVVESAMWNDAWRANAVDCWAEHRYVTEVRQMDVRCVAKALATLSGLDGLLDLQSVFTSEEGGKPVLEQLEPPFLSVAKSDSLIQVLPTALRFWDKLGLSPRAGKKDVCAFVFFEELDVARVNAVDRWLQWVSSTYTVGVH
jgi:mediator of RNA polymerase II transcription subunit 13, fungi type